MGASTSEVHVGVLCWCVLALSIMGDSSDCLSNGVCGPINLVGVLLDSIFRTTGVDILYIMLDFVFVVRLGCWLVWIVGSNEL